MSGLYAKRNSLDKGEYMSGVDLFCESSSSPRHTLFCWSMFADQLSDMGLEQSVIDRIRDGETVILKVVEETA